MGQHEIKKLLHGKGNSHQTEETLYRMGENLCQLYIWQGINNQNIQGTQKLTSQRINSPLNKMTNELNRQFSKEVQMTNKHIKNCSTSLAIKEMQIKTTLRSHLIPVRVVIINNANNNKCWQVCGGKGRLLHHWWECKLVQLLWKAIWRSLKKLKIELPYDPAIPFLAIYLKECCRIW
jgi:hypothetical protein